MSSTRSLVSGAPKSAFPPRRLDALAAPREGPRDEIDLDNAEPKILKILGETNGEVADPATEINDLLARSETEHFDLRVHQFAILARRGHQLEAERTVPSEQVIRPELTVIELDLGSAGPLRPRTAVNVDDVGRRGCECATKRHSPRLLADKLKGLERLPAASHLVTRRDLD